MATVKSGPGEIRVFEDFLGPEWTVAETAADSMEVGAFRIVGQGIANDDSGVVILETSALNGVAQLLTTNEGEHSIGLCTAKCFDVALMGPLAAEARVRFDDLDTKEFYFGFTDHNDDTAILEGETIHGATTVVTLTASDLCGFHFSAEYTAGDDEDWHMVYNGGTRTGEVLATNIDAQDDAVADAFQVLRIEIDPNGTARWLIDNVLKQTRAGAVSTTTNLAVIAMVEAKGAAIETVDIDYIAIEANRDWTV